MQGGGGAGVWWEEGEAEVPGWNEVRNSLPVT